MTLAELHKELDRRIERDADMRQRYASRYNETRDPAHLEMEAWYDGKTHAYTNVLALLATITEA